MSGSFSTDTAEGGNQFAEIILTGKVGSALSRILLAESISPGDAPSYELCKLLFSYHPLGHKMAEAPINMAQSQAREISIPVSGEERLKEAFDREWAAHGDRACGDALIRNAKTQSRIYGISSLVMGDRNRPNETAQQVDWFGLPEAAPYFTILDPLTTAGSLVLDQDPNSPDFQKATAPRVGNKVYHPSRCVVIINESPLYIEWTNSAFGFVGRSVYQRALFPMKTFLQSLITDWLVTVKVGLLVYKAKAPGSIQNNRIMQFFGWKRSQLKGGVSGQVLTIGEGEEIMSLNFQNLEGPAKFARDNALKNTAMAASMPARMLEQEELVSGFGEGTEDAKQIARFIDRMRLEMAPEYSFLDRVTQHRAWSPAFFEGMQKDFTEYRKLDYKTAFYHWQNSFTATWPNLLAEPDSKQIETEKVRFEAVVAVMKEMAPLLKDQANRAALVGWAADEVSSKRKLFSTPLVIDEQAEADYVAPEPPPLQPDVGDGADAEPQVERA